MAIHIDPEQNELHALQRFTDWRGKRVIEIGCGDGRLARLMLTFGQHTASTIPI